MSRFRQLNTNLRFTTLIVVIALVAGLGGLALPGRAASATPLHVVPSLSVTVPAGGTATLSVRAVALTPGATLPTGPLSLALEPLAPDRLRTAVYYGIDWGYTETAPAQVVLAVWHLQDGVWRAPDHDIAERISAGAATSQGTPSWLADGRSVLQAVAQGQARLSDLTLTPLAETASAGVGTLTVTNTAFGDAVLHLPYGTMFTGPSGSVIVWAAPALPGVQVTPSAQSAEPTSVATATPSATVTIEPSATPALAPPYSGDPPSVKGTATTVSEATATPAPKEPTATPEPPTATVTPTATAVPDPPSATPVPTDTPLPEPTQTPAGQPQDQPIRRQSPESEQAAPLEAADPAAAAGKAQEAVPDAPLPPSSSETSTPSDEQAENEGAPAPVGTSAAALAPVPQPVGTQPGTIIPPPVPTVLGTRTPGTQVPPPVASVPPASPTIPSPVPSPSPSPTEAVGEKADPTETVDPNEENPVEQPTPAPTPVPVPPTPAAPISEGPIINVAPGDTPAGAAGGTGQPSAGESGSSGVPQTYNPNTGGGQAMTPLWLGLLSATMVLGGWYLRRMSRPTAVRLHSDDNPE